MITQVILIHSGNRCGKDTVAELIRDALIEIGKSVIIMAFALPLKEEVAGILGVTVDELDIMKNNKEVIEVDGKPIETRDFIIEHSERVKKQTNDYHYGVMAKELVLQSGVEYVIMSDLRFIEEYELFLDKGSYIYVDSDLPDCTEPFLDKSLFKTIVTNKNGDLEHLKHEVDNFITNSGLIT